MIHRKYLLSSIDLSNEQDSQPKWMALDQQLFQLTLSTTVDAIYITISLADIIFNSLTCLLFYKYKPLRKSFNIRMLNLSLVNMSLAMGGPAIANWRILRCHALKLLPNLVATPISTFCYSSLTPLQPNTFSWNLDESENCYWWEVGDISLQSPPWHHHCQWFSPYKHTTVCFDRLHQTRRLQCCQNPMCDFSDTVRLYVFQYCHCFNHLSNYGISISRYC